MFDLHHAQSSWRYFDRKYFNRRMRFFIRQACVCRHFAASIYTHLAPRQNGGTHKASWTNKKRILRLKYGQNIAQSFGHDINRTYCTETHSYLCLNSANTLHNRCLLAVSRGRLWIFVESRLEVKPYLGHMLKRRDDG